MLLTVPHTVHLTGPKCCQSGSEGELHRISQTCLKYHRVLYPKCYKFKIWDPALLSLVLSLFDQHAGRDRGKSGSTFPSQRHVLSLHDMCLDCMHLRGISPLGDVSILQVLGTAYGVCSLDVDNDFNIYYKHQLQYQSPMSITIITTMYRDLSMSTPNANVCYNKYYQCLLQVLLPCIAISRYWQRSQHLMRTSTFCSLDVDNDHNIWLELPPFALRYSVQNQSLTVQHAAGLQFAARECGSYGCRRVCESFPVDVHNAVSQ